MNDNFDKPNSDGRCRILLVEYGELVENLRHWDRVFWRFW